MAKSASVAGRDPGRSGRARSSAASTTPSSARLICGQELVGDVLVHEQGLGRVADARPLHLGVDDDALGHGEIGGGVDIDVAVAVPVEHVGNRGLLEDHRQQAPGPPRGMRQSMQPRSRTNSTAVSCEVSSTSNDGVGRQAGLVDRLAQRRGDDAVGLERAGRSPQERRVARLQAQGGGVGGDVRAVLVDDPDDAERDPDALDAQPVRPHVALDDLADGVGQGRDGPQPVGHRGDTRLGEPEPVDHRRRRARLERAGDVVGVRAQDLVAPLDQAARRPARAPRPWPRRATWRAAGRPPWHAGRDRASEMVDIAQGYRASRSYAGYD